MRQQVVQETVAAYFTAIENKDPDAWLACFETDAMIYDPGTGTPIQSQNGKEQFFRSFTDPFDAIAIEQDSLLVAGSRVSVKFHARCSSEGGKEVAFEGMDMFEIDQLGRITKNWPSWDTAKTMAQVQGITSAS